MNAQLSKDLEDLRTDVSILEGNIRKELTEYTDELVNNTSTDLHNIITELTKKSELTYSSLKDSIKDLIFNTSTDLINYINTLIGHSDITEFENVIQYVNNNVSDINDNIAAVKTELIKKSETDDLALENSIKKLISDTSLDIHNELNELRKDIKSEQDDRNTSILELSNNINSSLKDVDISINELRESIKSEQDNRTTSISDLTELVNDNKASIDTINNTLDTLLNTNGLTDVIDTFKDVKTFLDGFNDSELENLMYQFKLRDNSINTINE